MSCGGCTECCKAPTVFRYVYPGRKKSYPDLIYWKRISKRRAKKLNPHLAKYVQGHGTVSHFRCTKLTDTGCSVYEDRPRICSSYLSSEEDMQRSLEVMEHDGNSTEYTDNCNLIGKWRMNNGVD